VVRLAVVLCTSPVGRLERPGSTSSRSFPPVDDELPRLYVGTNLTGRLNCPYDEYPPDSLVVWNKDGETVDATSTWQRRNGSGGEHSRLRLGRGGTLVFTGASSLDEGVYSCQVYSPLHEGPVQPPFRVLVRGKWNLFSLAEPVKPPALA